MGKIEYEKAYKLGKKEYQKQLLHGENPYLPALDDILPPKGDYSELPLGLVEIPSELLVGTKTSGRSNAFASNFMPILDDHSEFADKWSILSDSHKAEGIHTPIKAYEYLNKFYVQEGNKRVSVFKFFEAPFIPGTVTRLIPKRTNELENRIYFEFLDFYALTEINYVWFSKEGSFQKLQELVGKAPGELWTEDERKDFYSIYLRFKMEYEKKEMPKQGTIGDAFLALIEVHGYKNIVEMLPDDLRTLMEKSWEEFELLGEDEDIELKLDPTEKKTLLGKLHLLGAPKLKIAFLYEKTPMSSAWTYGHELGRLHLEQMFPEEVETFAYENVTQENVEAFIAEAIKQKCNLIFTTTPAFAQASVKAAIENPTIKFLNCSLNTSHRYIRTYYARMYEAKFLMGAIAGAMAENNRISYIADYPIHGTIANINAFALGAKMVNPRAQVYLEWTCVKDRNVTEHVKAASPSCISTKDLLIPDEEDRYFGIYHIEDGKAQNLAMPLMHWGKFYEQLIRAIMDGSWKYDDDTAIKAINYWWGMSAGVVDVICSRNLPIGTKRLIEFLKETIMKGEFNPFTGILYAQDGMIQDDASRSLTPEKISHMDWLAENVVGHIPTKEELLDTAIPVVAQQGIEKKG
ncbi:MAG: BMP family ABC transporter substrate-binding protein [Faecalimonas sp.]|nr:BMP family ABC transporter substrate-binding protein [Faecalimonas sp.]